MRRQHPDYEIAIPLYKLQGFASGTGHYTGLPPVLALAILVTGSKVFVFKAEKDLHLGAWLFYSRVTLPNREP